MRVSFATQIATLFILLWFIPTCVLFFISFGYFQRNLSDKTMSFALANLNQAANNAGNSLKNYENALLQLVYNEHFLNDINDIVELPFLEALDAQSRIYGSMRAFTLYYTDIYNIMVVTDNEHLIVDRNVLTITEEYRRNFPPEITGIDVRGGEHDRWLPTRNLINHQGHSFYVLTFRQRLIDIFSNNDYGMMVISVNNNFLRDICVSSMVSDDPGENSVFIMHKDGTIITNWDRSLSGQSALEFMEAETLSATVNSADSGDFILRHVNGEQVYISAVTIHPTDWLMVSMVSRGFMTREAEAYSRFTLLTSFILLCIALLVAYIISKTAERSVQKITSAMNQAEISNLTIRIEIEEQNEFGKIAQHFNNMMETVERLMDDLRIQSKKEKEAEIRALEAQIKPHFLYNTLDSINWMAIDNNQWEISEALGSLAALFRYTTVNSNQMVLISKEEKYLEEYLRIQKMRFGSRFDYLFDIDPTIGNYYIYKMLFQPFIENSVIHAFSGMEHGGLLKVSIKSIDDDHLEFSVHDNGKGMRQEEADRLFYEGAFNTKNIGIANVIARLKVYYEEDYIVKVQSAEGEGMKLDIVFPKISFTDYSRESQNISDDF